MTALLFAAALSLEQAAPAQSAPPPAQLQASVVVPTAQPAPEPPAPAPAPPAASTTPMDPLEQAPSVRPFEMPVQAPAGPVPYASADATPRTSVKVEDYHRSYEGPEDSTEAYYDAGVRGAFAAEQALHGRLDGMWTVSGEDGAALLSLVISDPGEGDPRLGGAWRDLARTPGPDTSGVIDQVVREGVTLVVRIRLKDDAPALTLRLTPSADGRWRGQLVEDGKSRPVVMERKAL